MGWHATQLACVNRHVGLSVAWELVHEPAVEEVDILI